MINEHNRSNLIHAVAVLFLSIGIGLSLPLWMGERLFPMAPLFGEPFILPPPLDMIIVGLMVVCFTVSLFLYRTKALSAGLLLLLFLLVQDQMRWQPWVYVYGIVLLLFVLLPSSLGRKSNASSPTLSVHSGLQVLLIGIYFWSGFNKMNPGFTEVTYRLMASNLFGLSEQSVFYQSTGLGYLIPITEMAVAVGLFFPKSRKTAAIGAVLTHLVIIAYLLSMGSNLIVLPWNVAMIAFVLLAFWGIDQPIAFRKRAAARKKNQAASYRTSWVMIALLLLTWLMPALRFVGKWDNYLAFNLYSDNIKYLYIGMRGNTLAESDTALQAYFLDNSLLEEGKTLDVFTWALEELNVPVYPERRVYQSIAKQFCQERPEELMFIEYSLPFSADRYEVFRCQDWAK